MSNIVELNLDDTLADFEVQDWIDNVFSVQYPYIQATIKKGCQGNCGDKYKEENEQLKQQIEKMKQDVEELKDSSFDAGMFLAVDEVLIKWKKELAE